MLSDETNITAVFNMSHLNDATKNRKDKRINYEARLKIEASEFSE